MYVGPLTSESAKALRAAQDAADRHLFPWWAFGYRPSRPKAQQRRHDIAATIAPAVEKCVRQSIAAGLATLDDPAWADAVRAAIDLVSAGEEWAPVAKPAAKSAPLPPFSGPGGPCPKCATGAFKRASFHVIAGPAGRSEFLRRYCECGYEWSEQCADAQPIEESVPDVADVPAEAAAQ